MKKINTYNVTKDIIKTFMYSVFMYIVYLIFVLFTIGVIFIFITAKW